TKRKQDAAANSVEDVYTLKTEYADNRVDLMTSIFDYIEETNAEAAEEYGKRMKEWEKLQEEDRGPAPTKMSASEKLSILNKKLPEDLTEKISPSVFTSLLSASTDQLSRAEDAILTAVNTIMKSPIPAKEVENAKNKVEQELRYTSLDNFLKESIYELARFAIIQNEYFDVEATEEKRQEAIDKVDPVRILEGQIIVEEGQLVSRDMYRQLKLLGL